VYPNPFEWCHAKFSAYIKGPIQFKLVDMAGKVVVHGDELSDQNTLTIESLGHLPRYLYPQAKRYEL
jgi:hypothetical protein